MASFTDEAWSSPESELDAAAFCAVSLIDDNPAGKDKIKANCSLPVRSRPDAAVNRNAVHAAAGGHGISRVQGISAEARRKAAKRLVALYRQMGEVAPEHVYRLAGERRPAEKSQS
jgi:hypothetical protein